MAGGVSGLHSADRDWKEGQLTSDHGGKSAFR